MSARHARFVWNENYCAYQETDGVQESNSANERFGFVFEHNLKDEGGNKI